MSLAAIAALAIVIALVLAAGRIRAPRLSGREWAGIGLLGLAGVLALARQPGLAVPAVAAGIAMLRGAIAGRPAGPSPGGTSEVRSDALAMTLDHDSGEMDGEVLAGRFAGRFLSTMGAEELAALRDELEDDPDSLGLLLAYMQRQPEADAEPARPPGGGGEMSEAEALRVLGLEPGASREEIRAAHRRLMRRVHPDLGGSDALASLINAAKARLDADGGD